VMDGIEATRRLRQMPQFANLPIVALAAGAFKSQQDAAQAAGMTHFISKPFDVPSTIALIQRLTRRMVAKRHTPVVVPVAAPAVLALAPQRDVIDMKKGLGIWTDMPSYLAYLNRFMGEYRQATHSNNPARDCGRHGNGSDKSIRLQSRFCGSGMRLLSTQNSGISATSRNFSMRQTMFHRMLFLMWRGTTTALSSSSNTGPNVSTCVR